MWNGINVRRNKCWCKRPKYLLHDLPLGLSRRDISFQPLSVARNGKIQNRLACIIKDDAIWAWRPSDILRWFTRHVLFNGLDILDCGWSNYHSWTVVRSITTCGGSSNLWNVCDWMCVFTPTSPRRWGVWYRIWGLVNSRSLRLWSLSRLCLTLPLLGSFTNTVLQST